MDEVTGLHQDVFAMLMRHFGTFFLVIAHLLGMGLALLLVPVARCTDLLVGGVAFLNIPSLRVLYGDGGDTVMPAQTVLVHRGDI